MIKNKESLVKQFRSDDPSTYLSNEDQQKAMLLETITIEDKKVKAKKRVVEPIEIPEVLSVPRTQAIKKIELPESNTRRSVGLSQRFTQDKIREAQILKQLDQELANERNRGRTLNKGGKKHHDRQV